MDTQLTFAYAIISNIKYVEVLVIFEKMDIYGNKRQPFTIALNGFAKTDYTVTELQQN